MLFLDTQRCQRYHERRHLGSVHWKLPSFRQVHGVVKSLDDASHKLCLDTWLFSNDLKQPSPIVLIRFDSSLRHLMVHTFIQYMYISWAFISFNRSSMYDFLRGEPVQFCVIFFFWPFSILSFQGMISPLGSRLGHLLETPMCSFSCYWDMTRYPVTSWISIEEEAVSQAGPKGGWRKLVALFSNCIKHDNCKSWYKCVVCQVFLLLLWFTKPAMHPGSRLWLFWLFLCTGQRLCSAGAHHRWSWNVLGKMGVTVRYEMSDVRISTILLWWDIHNCIHKIFA